MKVGYARTSTIDQKAGFEAQLRELDAAGCEKVFKEQVSSVGQREQLEAVLDFIREGDALVVTKLDRLARSIGDLSNITKTIDGKKANLQILGLGLDTSTATGRTHAQRNRFGGAVREGDDVGAPTGRDCQGEGGR